MADVALLNTRATDNQVSREMLSELCRVLDEAEKRLVHSRARTHEEYVEWFASAAAARRALEAAEKVFARNYKV